jgi:ADP-L-glycero-D-manno-heptose 6-epimerase
MKYLVTGSNGFIGKNLVSFLKNQGHKVITLEKNIFDSQEWNYRLQNLFMNFRLNGVFHVGACADTMSTNTNEMMIMNYEFTKILCDLCLDYKIKLVYSSSMANDGVIGTPSNLYGWSKYAAENYLTANRKGVSLRYCNVYGPGEEHKGKMASVAFQAFKKFYLDSEIKSFPLFPGKPTRDFVHIDDVISANVHAMNMVQEGTVWEVGSGSSIPFEEILEIFDIPYHHLQPDVIPAGYQFSTRTNNKKWMPDWKPKYEIKTGFELYKKDLTEKYLDNQDK